MKADNDGDRRRQYEARLYFYRAASICREMKYFYHL